MFSTLYSAHCVQNNTEIQTWYYSASAPLLCVGQRALSWQSGLDSALIILHTYVTAGQHTFSFFFLVKGFQSWASNCHAGEKKQNTKTCVYIYLNGLKKREHAGRQTSVIHWLMFNQQVKTMTWAAYLSQLEDRFAVCPVV